MLHSVGVHPLVQPLFRIPEYAQDLRKPGGIGTGGQVLCPELRAFDQEFAEDMEIAERIMREDRDVLRRLAG